jgi:MFS family permease
LTLSADLRLTLLFIGIFISGAARSFTSPAVFSMIPQIVPRPMIAQAAAWSSSSYQFAAIAGPAIGGLVFGAFGTDVAFALPPALMVLSIGLTGLLSPTTMALRNAHQREPFAQSLRSAIHFTLHHRVLLSAMTLDMFSVLFGGAVAVLPVFAHDVFKVGPQGLGILRAAPSVGSVIVALVLALRPMKVISGRVLLWCVAGFGVATVGFALSPNFIIASICLAASGAFDGVSMVIRSSFLQLLTPDNMRGRVSALSSVFITSSNEIGAFESGVAARFLGLITSVLVGGTMTLLVVGSTAVLVPELRQTRLGQEEEHKKVV